MTPELWRATKPLDDGFYTESLESWGLVRVPFDEMKRRGRDEFARQMGMPPELAEHYDNLIEAVLLAALGEDTDA